MARINLLPWREELRKERKTQFVAMAAGAVVLMIAAVAYVHVHIDGLIDYQESRNGFLKQNIREVEAKIREIERLEKKKKQLIARMEIIERLQQGRPAVVHMMDELVKAIPDGVFLANLQQREGKLILKGEAESNARVSGFMRNLDASAWLEEPTLEVIEGSGKRRSFTLHVDQSSGREDGNDPKGDT